VASFVRAAVIGVGLIGGSLGMAMRWRRIAREVVGVARVPETIGVARARGAIDRGTTDPVEGVAGADLVVLATPPELVVSMARQVLPYLGAGAIVTDVASVKREIVRDIEPAIDPDKGVAFVGGHPMAGNEGRGVAAASAELFEGSVYLITRTPRTDGAATERIATLARALGARPMVMDPEAHDRAVARVSHLPYLLAAALMGAAESETAAAGPSFLGATRVAGSPVSLWAQICRLNRSEIVEALRAFRDELDRLEGGLTDGADIDELLERARRARLKLSPRTEPETPAPRESGSRNDSHLPAPRQSGSRGERP
jgi:prephenate dehydrogenase